LGDNAQPNCLCLLSILNKLIIRLLGVFMPYGPKVPLTERGLEEFQRWEGDEYDLPDLAMQSLHQLYGHIRDARTDQRAGLIGASEAQDLRGANQQRIDRILDRHLTR
jgi:hypothetical protein